MSLWGSRPGHAAGKLPSESRNGGGADIRVSAFGHRSHRDEARPCPQDCEKNHDLSMCIFSTAFLAIQHRDGVETIWGIGTRSFRDVSNGFVFLKGTTCRGGHLPGGRRQPERARKAWRYRHLLNPRLESRGHWEQGKAGRIFVPSPPSVLFCVGAGTSDHFPRGARPGAHAAVIGESRNFCHYRGRPVRIRTLMTSTNIPRCRLSSIRYRAGVFASIAW